MVKYRFRLSVLFFVFQFAVIQVSAQYVGVDSLRSSAKIFFDKGDYQSALPYSEKLLILFPADGRYLYQTGVCLSNATLDLERAYQLLKAASLKNVSPEVYYHLGDLSRKLYRFDEAIEWFRQYMVAPGSKLFDKKVVEHQVTMCENGNFLTKYAASLKVLGQAKTSLDSLLYYYTVSPGKGQLTPIPQELTTKLDKKMAVKIPQAVYFPSGEGGEVEVIYFASYGKTDMHGLNLWRAVKASSGEWEQPTEFPSNLNTDGDEIFPIPAMEGSVLYFASNTIYGMGGYDIFKSTYDAAKGVWGMPENLGFPINSPADDFFYVPDKDGDTAMFASNRNAIGDSVVVYKVLISKNGINQTVTDLKEKVSISKLDISQQTLNESVEPAKGKDFPKARVEGLQYDMAYMGLMTSLTSLTFTQDSLQKQLDLLRASYRQVDNATADSVKSNIVKLEASQRDVSSQMAEVNRRATAMEEAYLTNNSKVDEPDVQANEVDFLYNKSGVKFFGNDRIVALRRLCGTAVALDSSFYSSLEFLRQEQDLKTMLIATDQPDVIQQINRSLAEIRSKTLLSPSEFLGKRTLLSVGLHNLLKERLLTATMNSEQNNSFQMANADMVSAQGIFNNNSSDAPTLDTYEGIRDGLWLEERGFLRYKLVVAQMLELKSVDSLSKLIQKLEHRGAIPYYVFEQPKPKVVIPSLKPEAKPVAIKTVKLKQDYSVGLSVVDPYPYSSENPIPFDQPFPAGVVYKIQLGAFSQPINFVSFKGLAPISGENLKGGAIKKYYAGIFFTLAQAQAGLVLAKSRGFVDAFVVGWLNGKIVPLSRARNFEERKSDTSKAVQPKSLLSSTAVDKNIFRLVIGTFDGVLPSRVHPILNEYAKNKEVAKKVIAEQATSFSVGNFINFEEAIRLKDALLSNGFVEAYVTKVNNQE